MKQTAKPVPDGYQTATPYLVIKGAAKAIEFYKKAFGAKEVYRMTAPDGTIPHADLLIGSSHVMVADEPENGKANGTGSSIFLYVDNVDAIFKKAIGAGATQVAAVEDMFWGDRYGKLTDPFGQEWQIATHKEDVSPDEMEKRMAAAFQ